MSDAGRFDEVLDALADPYRRQLLLALIQHNPQEDSDPDLKEEQLVAEFPTTS